MSKHAFLIIAHKDDYTLKALMSLIDHPSNDIYLHMDLKNKEFDQNLWYKLVKYSNLFIIERLNVQWGGYSQIEVELSLLKEAYNNETKYLYYHLISGEDLPIKQMNFIHNFFSEHYPSNFVRFENKHFNYNDRVEYYYPLQDILGRNKFNSIFNKISIFIQQKLNFQRNKNISFQKGTNWFSITEELTKFVLQNEDWINKVFKNTYCADEIFLQTLINNSDFKESLYVKDYNNDLKSIMRYIDWDRGKPYIFTTQNYRELLEVPYLFARKFNSQIDINIIKQLENNLIENNE